MATSLEESEKDHSHLQSNMHHFLKKKIVKIGTEDPEIVGLQAIVTKKEKI